MLSHIGDNIGYKKNAELCNRNLNNKHMAKDAEIEQVLSLSKEKWQRKKLRLPHSQKREVEKPQKRRSREPTLFKDYRRFCQSESDVHGSECKIRGSECKKHGSECGNRHIRSHDPPFRSEKSLPLKGNFRGV
jgi:ATP-dependent helicase/DNAse subunit B